MLGATPLLQLLPFPLTGIWPLAVFLVALSSIRLGLSIWAAILIVFVGIFQDFIGEAPLGAWAFAGLCAYGAGLIARNGFQALASSLPIEFVSILIGSLAGLFGLSLAGDIAGGAKVLDVSLFANLVWTLGLYYLVSPLFAPYDDKVIV